MTYRFVRPIPNTDLTIKHFNVSYILGGKELTEEEIRGDRMRIIAVEDGRPLSVAKKEEEKKAAETVDETGLGVWQTVAVKVVDEEQEALEQQQLKLQQQQEDLEKEILAKRKVKLKEDSKLYRTADSSLSAYNPYKSNMYKGFSISGAREDQHFEQDTLADGEIVSFKKRKKMNNSSSVNNVDSELVQVATTSSGSNETTFTTEEPSIDKSINHSDISATAKPMFQMKVKSNRNFRKKESYLKK